MKNKVIGEEGAILARALLLQKNEGKLSLLPSGTATIRRLQSVPAQGNGTSITATLYEISGLAFTPSYVWLDNRQQLFASISGWFSVVRAGYESSVPALRDSQRQVETERPAKLAEKLTHQPTGDLVVNSVSVFDTQTRSVVPNQNVTVHGERIVSIFPESGRAAAPDATVIDGRGKMLMPGCGTCMRTFSQGMRTSISPTA